MNFLHQWRTRTGLDWKLGRQQHESTQLHCRLLAGTGQISYVLTREREGDTIFRNGRCVHQLHELTNMPPGTSKPRHERCIQESESESVCLIEWDECSRSLCKRNLFLSCSQFYISPTTAAFVVGWMDWHIKSMQTRYIMLWDDCTCTTYLLKCFNAVWRLSFFRSSLFSFLLSV